jgi:hypothetical protein
MSATLIQTCPLCGLRYSNRALLELHIREDHLQQDHRAAPDRGDSGDSGTPQHNAGGSSRTNASASRLPRPEEAVTPRTATRRTHRPGLGWAMTAVRRAVRALRYVNDELLRASEAMIRSARAQQPRPRPEAPAGTDAQRAPDRT